MAVASGMPNTSLLPKQSGCPSGVRGELAAELGKEGGGMDGGSQPQCLLEVPQSNFVRGNKTLRQGRFRAPASVWL